MVNDVSLIWGIVSVFILVGFITPYVNDAFGRNDPIYNIDQTGNELEIETSKTNLNTFQLLKSISLMFFWTFGALPFWLDTIFFIMRIMLGLLVYRQVRSGGG